MMEKRRFLLLLLPFCCCFCTVSAQWEVPFGHFWTVKSYYNPAFCGETEQVRSTVLYRYPWTGFENAPQKVVVAVDMPVVFLHRRHGIGMIAQTEKIKTKRNALLAFHYDFQQPIGKGALNLGVQVGAYDLNFDAGNMQVVGDSLQFRKGTVKVSPADRKVIDLTAGLSWSGKRHFIGLSALHLNQPRFYVRVDSLSSADLQSDSTLSLIPRSVIFLAGYNIGLFHPLEIQPMVWALYDGKRKSEVVTTLRCVYDRRFSGGVSWRKEDGFIFFAGIVIEGVEAGYAYNLHTEGWGKRSRGSHEVSLRYAFPIESLKQKKQPHKSIRLL